MGLHELEPGACIMDVSCLQKLSCLHHIFQVIYQLAPTTLPLKLFVKYILINDNGQVFFVL